MKTPIEQLESALAEIVTLKESVGVLSTRAESAEALAKDAISAKAELEKVRGEIAEKDAAIAGANEKLSAISAERDAALAEVKKMKEERSLTPAAYGDVSNGTAPISSGSADDGAITWKAALSACGGNYVKARKDYPASYAVFMRENANAHKP